MPQVLLIAGELGNYGESCGRSCIIVPSGREGTVVYGPYEERPQGIYLVKLALGSFDDKAPRGNAICAIIDVVTGDGISLISKRHILYSELQKGLSEFELAFVLHEPRRVEYRVHTTGQMALNVATEATIEPLAQRNEDRPARGSQERAWENEREFLDGYLRNISGVIHVGANLGQERRYYWLIGVDVLWVEPIREIYDRLVDNIACYPRQRPIFALLGARDGEEVKLGIASNNGASSSILPLEDHKKIYPDVDYIEQRSLLTYTLPTLLAREKINLSNYEALTLDAEGAELMILQGAGELLKHFKYIKCEVADFPARTGTPTTKEIDAYLTGFGFRELARRPFGMGPDNIGTYWDIVWKRDEIGKPFQQSGTMIPIVMERTEVEAIEKCE